MRHSTKAKKDNNNKETAKYRIVGLIDIKEQVKYHKISQYIW